MAIQNSASNRSYLIQFAITAGQTYQDLEFAFVVPGDTQGTWLKDTGIGLFMAFTLAAGSLYWGAQGWQAGNRIITGGSINLLQSTDHWIELFDVGIYADDYKTGVPPQWEPPDYAQTLWECQRYYERMGVTAASNIAPWAYYNWQYKAEKRVAPAFGITAGAASGATYTSTISTGLAFRQNNPASVATDHGLVADARL